MMDDVPVKISEKYKPPPKVSIPQTIVNRLNSVGYPPGIFNYDFTLENNVIKSIEEWKRVREIEKANRQSRLQKIKLEQARELEERQKQLLTTVSYPNADEISSGDEAESDSSTIATSSTARTATPINTCNTPEILNQAFNQKDFNTILKPTVLPESTINNFINNPTVILKNNLCNNLKSNMSGKINYSDFENDTSSPFDNVELKTINDLDILAQVYNIPHSNNTENLNKEINNISPNITANTDLTINQNKNQNEIDNSKLNNFKTENSNVNTIADSNTISSFYWKNNNQNTSVQNSNVSVHQTRQNYEVPNTLNNHYYQLQQNYTNMNGSLSNPQQYMLNADNYYFRSGYGNVPVINQNYQFSNFSSNNTQDKISNSTNNYLNYSNFNNQSNYVYNSSIQPPTVTCSSPTITYGNLNQYRSSNNDQRIVSNIPIDNFNINKSDQISQAASNTTLIKNLTIDDGAIQSIKNKSKSVPDILKELDDEVRDSENRRARNHSQTLEDHKEKCKQMEKKIVNQLPESFIKLSPSSQNLIKNISSMGFPIERVAKIAEKLGTDDKKIFEHLIPLSELLDLGFDEEKISEALLKFDNNKDKALDYLIS